MNELEQARHEREQKEQQATRERLYEENQQRKHDLRMAEFKLIENGIKPLLLQPVRVDDNPHSLLTRTILTASGERVGMLRWVQNWSWKSGRYAVHSRRIPQHGRYHSGEGERFYKKLDSVIKAINKFCIAVSDDEERAKVLRSELRHYREVLQSSQRRSRSITGTYHGSLAVDGIVELLASDIGQDRVEGQEMIRVLVRKKRVARRFYTWVMEKFITPRAEELETLDTSKETVK